MKQHLKTLLVLLISVTMVASPTLAQSPDDFLEEDEFDAPPPPPTDSFPEGEPSQMPAQDFSSGPTSGGTNSGFDTVKKRKRAVPFSQAQPEDITNENFPEVLDSFDYPNAEISDVVKAISELTGKNFIVEPSVRGKITIIAPTPITVAEAYKAFLSALAINGFTVVPSGKFLKIRQTRSASRDNIEIYSGAYTPNTDQMVTRIIHLKHISGAEVNKQLRNLTSKDGEMSVYEPTNSVIISDYGSNIERVMKIIQQLDVQGFEEQLEVIPIRHAKAKDVADLIDQIINKGQSSKQGRGFTAGIPRFTRAGEQGAGNQAFSMVLPDDRTNAIIVVGNKAGIKKIRDLVKKLDYEIRPEDAGGVYVYYVKYGEAEKIAEALQGATKDQKKSSSGSAGDAPTFPPAPTTIGAKSDGAAGLFGGDVKITASKDTNSLIITASRQDYEAVLNLLSKLDIPKDQVYVEAVIMELDVQSQNSWGVNYYQFVPETNGIGRAGFSSGNLGDLLNVTGDQGAILGFGSGQTFDLKTAAGTATIKSFTGFVKFLKGLTNVNILSTPQLLAADNEEAEIEVGDTVPVGQRTTNTTGGASQTAIDREKATIKLKITPFISPSSSSVRLKVDQQIKQLSKQQVKAKQLAEASVVITERAVKTNITVNDGDTAVLGGLIREDEQTEENKVPILGDIPILGWLFKSSTVSKSKINLLIFLTPKIVRNSADQKNILGQKLNERLDFIKSNYGGRDPYGKTVDKMYRRASGSKMDTMSVESSKTE